MKKGKTNPGSTVVRVKTGAARARQICAEAQRSDSHGSGSGSAKLTGKRRPGFYSSR
jgi:hypothetical protein